MSWAEFSRRLAEALAAMTRGQFLIIETLPPHLYVQFASGGFEGMRVEAVSNAYLPPEQRLDPTQLDALSALGWKPPTHEPDAPAADRAADGSANHFANFDDPLPCEAVAELAVRTFAEVFRISGPGQLRYHTFQKQGPAIEFPMLGLATRSALPLTVEDPQAEVDAQSGTDGEVDAADGSGAPQAIQVLQQRLLDAIREITGWKDVSFDADGDLQLGVMGQSVFLRIVEKGPSVRLWCVLAAGIDESPALFRRLNELNATGDMRLRIGGGTVFGEHDLPADPLVPAVLGRMLVQFSGAVSGLDQLLQREFGGQQLPGRPPGIATLH